MRHPRRKIDSSMFEPIIAHVVYFSNKVRLLASISSHFDWLDESSFSIMVNVSSLNLNSLSNSLSADSKVLSNLLSISSIFSTALSVLFSAFSSSMCVTLAYFCKVIHFGFEISKEFVSCAVNLLYESSWIQKFSFLSLQLPPSLSTPEPGN